MAQVSGAFKSDQGKDVMAQVSDALKSDKGKDIMKQVTDALEKNKDKLGDLKMEDVNKVVDQIKKEKERRAHGIVSPNPKSNNANGIGSLCRNDAACGFVGQVNYRR